MAASAKRRASSLIAARRLAILIAHSTTKPPRAINSTIFNHSIYPLALHRSWFDMSIRSIAHHYYCDRS
jgi:hypothetical protein